MEHCCVHFLSAETTSERNGDARPRIVDWRDSKIVGKRCAESMVVVWSSCLVKSFQSKVWRFSSGPFDEV